jgi:hypothetical protein
MLIPLTIGGHRLRPLSDLPMKRMRAVAFLATICVSVAITSSSSARTRSPLSDEKANSGTELVTWQDLAASFTWPVLRPSVNVGLHLKQLDLKDRNACGSDYQGYAASYGSPPARAIELFIAKGFLCGDPEESAVVTHILVHGRRVAVYVPYGRNYPRKPTLADGYRYRIWLYWKQGGTVIYVQGSHLHLAELARVARSLTPIQG